MLAFVLVLVVTYLTGAIPVAYIYCKIRGRDITKEGSGNVGATNAARLFGKSAFFTIFFLDALKGFIPVYYFAPFAVSLEISSELAAIVVLFTVIAGHVWSIFIGFKGGKGVATSVGGLLAFMPQACLIAAVIFALVFAFGRIVSIASIIAAISFPVLGLLMGYPGLNVKFSIVLSAFIIFNHRTNIIRLFKGKENSFSDKKKE